MTAKQLEKYKGILSKERTEILKELAIERNSVVYNEQGDIVDIAESQISNTILSSISDLDQSKLKDIDIALKKIDNNNYGLCEGTGKRIPVERLNHIPWARYTIEYAQTLEQNKKFN